VADGLDAGIDFRPGREGCAGGHALMVVIFVAFVKYLFDLDN
jgi:L-cystine uptake protein TcyP (sodium:dicarboxylate symporter family)